MSYEKTKISVDRQIKEVPKDDNMATMKRETQVKE